MLSSFQNPNFFSFSDTYFPIPITRCEVGTKRLMCISANRFLHASSQTGRETFASSGFPVLRYSLAILRLTSCCGLRALRWQVAQRASNLSGLCSLSPLCLRIWCISILSVLPQRAHMFPSLRRISSRVSVQSSPYVLFVPSHSLFPG